MARSVVVLSTFHEPNRDAYLYSLCDPRTELDRLNERDHRLQQFMRLPAVERSRLIRLHGTGQKAADVLFHS